MNTKKDLENLGFKGFIPVKELLLDISAIPNVNGVYAVVRNNTDKPVFLKKEQEGILKDEILM